MGSGLSLSCVFYEWPNYLINGTNAICNSYETHLSKIQAQNLMLSKTSSRKINGRRVLQVIMNLISMYFPLAGGTLF
jgi:hypothetical protein